MGVAEFFKALGRVVGWVMIIISFSVYTFFNEYLEEVPKFIVSFGIVIMLTLGIGLVLSRNASRVRSARKEGEVVEKIVHITPMDDMKHDILGLLAFIVVVGWIFLTKDTVDTNDLVQGGLAFVMVMLVRKIYREKLY